VEQTIDTIKPAPNTINPLKPPSTDAYFNSVWENIMTRDEDPYTKVTLENKDPMNIEVFEPTYMYEKANTTPIDLSSLMRRPPTERDLDLGTSALPLFARSMLYDLYESPSTNSPDTTSSAVSTMKRRYGTDDDPIEIVDSPPISQTKSRKRPLPQDSPVKNQKKLERRGAASTKPIAPVPKRKTKRE
jgi:hypothetical protein